MTIRVYLGFDGNESVAWSVAAHSISRRSSVPVSIIGLRLKQLRVLTRARDPAQSTEFAFSRFLVPWLSDFEGVSVFMDSDVLVRGDVAELVAGVDPHCALSVVKHEYEPRPEDKFLGQRQTVYERKNWSSVMVFSNPLCRALSPGYVNRASGLELHRFKWLGDEEIGSLEPVWNHLIGEQNQCRIEDAKVLHYTRGTPCFAAYAQCPGAQEWRDELTDMLSYNRMGEYSLPVRDAA